MSASSERRIGRPVSSRGGRCLRRQDAGLDDQQVDGHAEVVPFASAKRAAGVGGGGRPPPFGARGGGGGGGGDGVPGVCFPRGCPGPRRGGGGGGAAPRGGKGGGGGPAGEGPAATAQAACAACAPRRAVCRRLLRP